MRKIKILHLACYSTNIGDCANIDGIRRTLQRNLPDCEITFTDEDMIGYSEFMGKKRYDCREFVALANSHDAMIIGGGGLFSGLSHHDKTGCYVGLDIETLERIQVPVIYYALGFASYYGQKYKAKSAFGSYLEYLTKRPNTLISVRNDGSLKRLGQIFGHTAVQNITTVPDGGFHMATLNVEHKELSDEKPLVTVQLAGDKQRYRFREEPSISYRLMARVGLADKMAGGKRRRIFLSQLSSALVHLVNEQNIRIVFVPHIPADLEIISEVLSTLPRDISRLRSTVAPVVSADSAYRKAFDLYRHVDMVVGMRFHGNVCPIGMGVPTLGLGTHPQLPGLYDELGLQEHCMDVLEDDFEDMFFMRVIDILGRLSEVNARYKKVARDLDEQTTLFQAKMKKLILS